MCSYFWIVQDFWALFDILFFLGSWCTVFRLSFYCAGQFLGIVPLKNIIVYTLLKLHNVKSAKLTFCWVLLVSFLCLLYPNSQNPVTDKDIISYFIDKYSARPKIIVFSSLQANILFKLKTSNRFVCLFFCFCTFYN